MVRVVERTRQTARELGVGRVLSPIRDFIQTEASSGILLLLAATVALIWANSRWSDMYIDLWHFELTIGIGQLGLTKSLLHWINDGLMAIFFFVIGLEIKREILRGELASVRQAVLPIVAAAGGAALPALVYVAMNAGSDNVRGWGVPMATDIAFALGLLALLGSHVPIGLKIFVTALAIVDDLIAVLVIALFYTERIDWGFVGLAAMIFATLIGINRIGVSRLPIYGVLGVSLWFVFVHTGVHATIAGVLLAATIPSTAQHEQRSPMSDLEHLLHPWVAFVVVPLFALANAGVLLTGGPTEAATSTITLGVVAGLIVGKQVGITLFTWVMIRGGITSLPAGVTMRHIYGASCLAGIGFTMSLFIADLAFQDADRLADAKLGILLASLLAGLFGWAVLRVVGRPVTARVDHAPASSGD